MGKSHSSLTLSLPLKLYIDIAKSVFFALVQPFTRTFFLKVPSNVRESQKASNKPPRLDSIFNPLTTIAFEQT